VRVHAGECPTSNPPARRATIPVSGTTLHRRRWEQWNQNQRFRSSSSGCLFPHLRQILGSKTTADRQAGSNASRTSELAEREV